MKKNVLLIGDRSTIGKSLKKILIQEGYEVHGTNSSNLDLLYKESVDNFILSNNKVFNHVVFLAAINNPQPFTELDIDSFDNSYKINFQSFIYLLRKIINKIPKRRDSSITIVSSIYGIVGRKNRFLYSSSKHFLVGAMKTLAVELARYNIRVNCVSPGYINTRMTRKNNTKDQIKKIVKKIPMNRLGRTNEVATLISFLMSKKASYLTGQDIVIDGGVMAGGLWED